MSDTPQQSSYRAFVTEAWADERSLAEKVAALAARQEQLGLTDEQAAAVECEVIGQRKEEALENASPAGAEVGPAGSTMSGGDTWAGSGRPELPPIDSLSGEHTVPGGARSDALDRLRPGVMVAGRFEVLESLGKGGMGQVWKVRDTKLDELRALKVIRPELVSRADILERFRDEVKTCQKLAFPNIVRVFDYDEDAAHGLVFYTMELVPGCTLRAWLNQRRQRGEPVSPAEFHLLVNGIGAALAYAHRFTVHRDLKPENVLVAEDLTVIKLTDFGIAKAIGRKAAALTQAGMGTPYYVAPEQERGGRVESSRPASPSTRRRQRLCVPHSTERAL